MFPNFGPRTQWSHRWTFSLLTGALLACQPESPSESSPQVTGGRIVSTASTLPPRRSTLALTNDAILAQGRSFCTATLIAPQIALTAAHCVTDQDGNPISLKDLKVVNGVRVHPRESQPVGITSLAVHRRYRPGALELGEWLDFNDLALLRLTATPPKSRPVALVEPHRSPRPGSSLTIAGYGVTSTRAVNDTGTLRYVEVKVIDVDEDAHVLTTQGARRPGVALNPPNYLGRRRLQPIRAGACAGDSGGPAFVKGKNSKTWTLVGALSFGEEMERVDGKEGERFCVGVNGYTDLAPYVPSIKKAAAGLMAENFCPQATFEFDEEGLKPLASGQCQDLGFFKNKFWSIFE